jgi:serine/threonine-protein kinase
MSSSQPPGNRSGEPDSSVPLSGWIRSHATAASPSSGQPSPPELQLAPGTLLAGRYRIVAPLGRGGMGEVYRAEDIKLGQSVALKFLRGAVENDPAQLDRLLAEVRIGREVSHPNVCRLYDVVEVDGRHFIAMEYVDGENLASLLSRIGRLPSDKALELARDLCAGLAAVHDKGVVHRDLKPANVMIDGRGRARITDFGLAASKETAQSETFAGTPAYMSPEQLAGGEATQRSDLYALGLVMFEMFTGRPFYDARTLADLFSQHRESKASRLAPLPRTEPVERFVQQCLSEDPLARPASVRAVASLLPGGDPLDALVAAGETPSPEMVAAAGRVGDLSVPAAWAAFLGALAALALCAYFAGRTTLVGKAPPAKPPEVLVERSRQVLARLGYAGGPADSAYGFDWDPGFLSHHAQQEPARERWQGLRQARPGPWYFFYRTSPRRLVAANRDALVRIDDPPLDVSGMTSVVLDAEGQLTGFTAVPPQLDEAPVPAADPDWSPLLNEAGLDPATLKPAAPRWAAPVDSDRKAAWDAVLHGQATTFRVEAAAYHGRVVWFALQPPWLHPDRMPSQEIARVPVGATSLVVLALAIPVGAVLLARRNVRLGRGDRAGAFTVALFVFCAYAAARLFQADHVASFGQELWLLVKVFAYPAFWAGLVWLLYMALEPYARRRWPHMLIAWKRLLAGRLRDPLVGRDVLLGCLLGASTLASRGLTFVVPVLLGAAEPAPDTNVSGPTITALRHTLFRLLVNQYGAVLYGLMFLFILVLFRMLLRNGVLAALAWALVVAGPIPAEDPQYAWVSSGLRAVVYFLALTRGGLLCLVATLFTLFTLVETPLTLDLSAWYLSRSVPQLLTIAGLAFYGFRISLAGKPAFGRLIED